MSFPSNQGTQPNTLAQALDRITRTAGIVKAAAQAIRAASLSGAIGANQVIVYVTDLAEHRDLLAQLAATPGLASFAQAQYNGAAFNIVTEFNAMAAAIDSVRAWIVANFPKDAQGNLLEKKFDANGRVTMNTFSTAALAPFRTQLDALIATID